MAHNCGYIPDTAVRIGWPNAVRVSGRRSRVERCHPFGHRLIEQRVASGTGSPLVLARSVAMPARPCTALIPEPGGFGADCWEWQRL
jgi:hypothetical protein